MKILVLFQQGHKMVLTVLKTTFPKVKYFREILYRDYMKFNDINFQQDLKAGINENKENIYVFKISIFSRYFSDGIKSPCPIRKRAKLL